MPGNERSEMIVAGQDGGVLVGRFRVFDDYVTDRPAGRDDWLAVYTLGGQGYVRTPEAERRCEAGELVLLKAGVPHRYGTSPGASWTFLWAHFPGDGVDPILLPDAGLTVRPIGGSLLRARVHRAFRRMLEDAGSMGPYWTELCLGALHEVLALSSRSEHRRLDPRVEETLRRLQGQLREPVRIDELAAAAGLSASRLSHLFKAETGQSIVETANSMRIRQAALMLEYTRLGAAEIAYNVGYQNYNHFLAQFRKRYGTSPSRYRMRLLGEEI